MGRIFLGLVVLTITAAALQAQQGGPVGVYSTDFTAGVDPVWSANVTSKTPSGRTFLGKFGNETVTLRLRDLPEHERLRVTFELFVIDTWDGSGRVSAANTPAGPDYFEVDLAGGPTLLRSTFSTLPLPEQGFDETGKRQTFPAPIPSRPSLMGTGANGVNQLGYIFTFKAFNVSFPMDANYVLGFTIPHSGREVGLEFTGAGLTGLGDESWGIANVKVQTLTAADVTPITPAVLPKLWERLVDPAKPIGANKAFWRLVENPEATVAFLEQHAEGFGVDELAVLKHVEALQANLDDTAALASLVEMGPPIEPVLRAAVAGDRDLRPVMLKVLREIEVTPIESPQARRAAAASRLLGVIDTPAARDLQAKLIARPRPQLQPGTPEHDAEWLTRFQAVYRLEPGQVLKYIPPGNNPDRDKYVQEHRTRAAALSRSRFDPAKDPQRGLGFVAWTTGRLTYDQPLTLPDWHHNQPEPLAAKGLRRYTRLLNIQGDTFRTQPPLYLHHPPRKDDTVDLPGDWLVRSGATQEQLLPALLDIVKKHTGRDYLLDHKKLNVDVVVVTGRYVYKADKPDDAANVVHVYSQERNRSRVPGAEKTTISKFCYRLSYTTGTLFIDETGQGETPLEVAWHFNTLDQGRSPEEYLSGILVNLSKQTSLRFKQEKRSFEYPAIVERKDAGVEK